MSKGNPIVRVRFTPAALAELDAEAKKMADHYASEEEGRSAFVRAAVKEFIRKRQASRARRGKRYERQTGQ